MLKKSKFLFAMQTTIATTVILSQMFSATAISYNCVPIDSSYFMEGLQSAGIGLCVGAFLGFLCSKCMRIREDVVFYNSPIEHSIGMPGPVMGTTIPADTRFNFLHHWPSIYRHGIPTMIGAVVMAISGFMEAMSLPECAS